MSKTHECFTPVSFLSFLPLTLPSSFHSFPEVHFIEFQTAPCHCTISESKEQVRMCVWLKFQLLFSFCLFFTPLWCCVWIATCSTLLRFVAFIEPAPLLCSVFHRCRPLLSSCSERDGSLRSGLRKISQFDLSVHVWVRGAQNSWVDACMFIMFSFFVFKSLTSVPSIPVKKNNNSKPPCYPDINPYFKESTKYDSLLIFRTSRRSKVFLSSVEH